MKKIILFIISLCVMGSAYAANWSELETIVNYDTGKSDYIHKLDSLVSDITTTGTITGTIVVATNYVSSPTVTIAGNYTLPTGVPTDNQIIKYDAATGTLGWEADATGGGGVSFGANNQIPSTNATVNDFDYSATFTWDGTSLLANTLTLTTGSITDSSGAISFGNENLTTTGTLGAGAITGTSLAVPTITATGDLTLDPAGNDVILDNANLQVQSTYNIGFNNDLFNPRYFTYFLGYSAEFLSTANMDPWGQTLINSGTAAQASTVNGNHPGVARITSSISANSGQRVILNIPSLMLGGSESTEFIFSLPATDAGTTIRMGFNDTQTITAPVDGVWIEINNTTLDGRTSNNSTSSTTGSTYTVTTATWYRAKIVLNSDATRADFYLYNVAGTELWTNNLTTNIPTARATGHGLISTNSGTTAIDLIDIDYMNFYINRVLVR